MKIILNQEEVKSWKNKTKEEKIKIVHSALDIADILCTDVAMLLDDDNNPIKLDL